MFALHGDGAWELDTDQLIGFFRGADQTSDVVGRRQASTFQALASFAGHGEVAAPAKPGKPKEPKAKQVKPANGKAAKVAVQPDSGAGAGGNVQPRDVGLTVRIEVNLPAVADQETYDRIFRSIRENLLNAK